MESANVVQTKVQTIISELETVNIELGNYKRYVEKVNTTNETIEMQIENLITEYMEKYSEYEILTKRASFKETYENGIVEAKAYDDVKWFNKKQNEVVSLRAIQVKMQSILIKRISDLLGNTKAFEIERDAIARVKEMVDKTNDNAHATMINGQKFYKEQMDSRMQIIEERQRMMQERLIHDVNNEREKIYDLLKTFADKIEKGVELPKIDTPDELFAEVERAAKAKVEARKPIAPPEKPSEEENIVDVPKKKNDFTANKAFLDSVQENNEGFVEDEE